MLLTVCVCVCLFVLQKQAKGQALLDLVFNHLELIERDFFGLQYIEACSSNDNPRVSVWGGEGL